MSFETVSKRIERMKALANPDSLEVRQALTRIATVLQAEIKQNIGREKIIDNGGLLNSIRYEISQTKDNARLIVGSFGIKYAAINEFGGSMTDRQVRAMFAALRFKKKDRGAIANKGVVTVFANGTGSWRARPFIRPAIQKHSNFIVDILRSIAKT